MSRREPSGAHTEIALVAIEAPPTLRGDSERVFSEPWEAQVFALALALHERGLFTWSEWAQALSQEIRRAEAEGDSSDGSTYYRHWLSAIERLVTTKSVTSTNALAERRAAWDRAAHATPHGAPILLDNDPQARPPTSTDQATVVRGALKGREVDR